MKFKATIKGLSPLLMHKFSEEKLLQIKKGNGGDKRLSDAEKKVIASQFLYSHKGKVVQPSAHIEGAMTKVATELRLSGAGKKTYKDLVKSSVFVFPEYIPHKNQKWEVDGRPVVNPTTRGRSMCYRPRMDEWSLDFEIEVLDDRADKDAIEEILKLAGLRCGIGSYRPRFGRFTVTSFKQISK